MPLTKQAMRAEPFQHFVAIDWSGAAGQRHKNIAIAMCSIGNDAPHIISHGQAWSRPEVLAWLRDDLPDNSLVGLDLGMSLPFVDYGAFLPGWPSSPTSAAALWAMVERICTDDPYLGASNFVDHPEIARHFRRHAGRQGDLFTTNGRPGGRGRLRVAELAQATMGCRPTSNFNLVGASQVGKSSLTGMRVLHHVHGDLPIWPVDPLPASGSVLVEIYTTLAAMAAGRPPSRSKMRSLSATNDALMQLASQPIMQHDLPIDDNKADALVAAAWLRLAAFREELWRPAGLTRQIALIEGWTFGAVFRDA